MKLTHMTAAVLAALALGACDRNSTTAGNGTVKDAPISVQAENQVERAGAAIDDATITAKVKSAFIADPRVKGLSIDVDTRQNVVTLNGAAQSSESRDQAETIAKSVEGVKEVKNNLTVNPQDASTASASPEYSQSMQHLQEAAQRLRESIQAMAQEPAGARRDQAIKAAQQALLDSNSAMSQLPPELRGGSAVGVAPSTGSTTSAGATGSVASTGPNTSQSMELLQKAAQQLRDSTQAMAQQPAGPRRNEAIKESNQALLDVNQAMTQLPPELRIAK